MSTAVKVILVIAGIVIIVVLWVSNSSGTGAGDAVIPTVACNQKLSTSGETMSSYDTSRFGPHRNWVAARSAMSADLRAEAEAEANSSLDNTISSLSCPEECPNLVRDNKVTYATTSQIIGNAGFGWMRYDGSASSQASDTFTCKP